MYAFKDACFNLFLCAQYTVEPLYSGMDTSGTQRVQLHGCPV